eukprot:scaffold491570_cov45-Prasinocladus_malaysianus.AAC.3
MSVTRHRYQQRREAKMVNNNAFQDQQQLSIAELQEYLSSPFPMSSTARDFEALTPPFPRSCDGLRPPIIGAYSEDAASMIAMNNDSTSCCRRRMSSTLMAPSSFSESRQQCE